jgi:GST-like protein
MIDLYFAPTPNTWKVAIMLEECALPYRAITLDLGANEQKRPAFLAINPNGRVPAIVDHGDGDGPQAVFESGAILLYLAEKTGRFLAPAGHARISAIEWLMWQMGGLGPMAGQAHHFRFHAPAGNDYAAARYVAESARLYGVMDGRLAGHEWLAGDLYSIADMACWGWVWFHRMQGLDLGDFPQVARWFFAMSARPAVERARLVGMDAQPQTVRDMMSGPYYDPPAP